MEKNNNYIYLLGFILALGTFFILPNNDDFYCLLAPHKYEDINVFYLMEHSGDLWMHYGGL